MQLFKTIILRSNIWISLGAPAMILVTCLEWDQAFPPHLGAASFFFVLLSYNLQRVVRELRGDELLSPSAPSPQPMRWGILFLLLAALGTLFTLFTLKPKVLVALCLPAFLSVSYALPIWGSGKGLRDLAGVKTCLIALSWAYLSVLIPALQLGIPWDTHQALLFLERFLFVFAITIPFDIRDLPYDDPSEKNLVQFLGMRTAKRIAMVALFLFLLSVAYRYGYASLSSPLLFGYLTTLFPTLLLIWKADPDRTSFYYEGALDGTMLFMALVCASFDRLL